MWEEERAERGLKAKQSFVDLGCGNGLLVHILSTEGVRGASVADSSAFPECLPVRDKGPEVFHCGVCLAVGPGPRSAGGLGGWGRGWPSWIERGPRARAGCAWGRQTSHSTAVVAVGCSVGNGACRGPGRGTRGSGFCPPGAGLPAQRPVTVPQLQCAGDTGVSGLRSKGGT